jgi:hypothetical protein
MRPSARSQIVFGEVSLNEAAGVQRGQTQGGVNNVLRSVVADVSNAVHSMLPGSVVTLRA